MNIGIDLDDTITDMPEFFTVICAAFLSAGHEVHIITYRDDNKEAKSDLDEHDIKYTALHLPPENVKNAETWKAQVAKELNLDLMIDDSPEVLAALPKTCKRMWLCDREVFDLGACIRAMKLAGE